MKECVLAFLAFLPHVDIFLCIHWKSLTMSAWQTHLTKFRASHPKLSMKECMQQASKSYHSKARSTYRSSVPLPLKKRPREEETLGTLTAASGIELRDFSHMLTFPKSQERKKCWYINIDTTNQSLLYIFNQIAKHVTRTYTDSHWVDNRLICIENFPDFYTVLNKMRKKFQKANFKLVLVGTPDYLEFKFEQAL